MANLIFAASLGDLRGPVCDRTQAVACLSDRADGGTVVRRDIGAMLRARRWYDG